MSGLAGGIYQGFYVHRGNVPERPIGELKNGLHMDRLSSHRFLANGHKLGALVQATHRHIWFKVASHWPGATLLIRAAKAVESYVKMTLERWQSQNLFTVRAKYDACDRSCSAFAPLPLK